MSPSKQETPSEQPKEFPKPAPLPEIKGLPFDWTLSNTIRLLREITLLIVLGYLAYSFISGGMTFSFGSKLLTASELISIMLAFFAILLSAAFYYMSTNQNNLFYNNVQLFTKDTSEILGRLDEQVKGLGGKQDDLSHTIRNQIFDKKDEKSEEVQDKNEEVFSLFNQILKESNLNASQKEDYENKINKLQEEVKILTEEANNLSKVSPESYRRVKNLTLNRLKHYQNLENYKRKTRYLLLDICKNAPSGYLRDMFNLGYINHVPPEDLGNITNLGREFIRGMIDEVIDNPTQQS